MVHKHGGVLTHSILQLLHHVSGDIIKPHTLTMSIKLCATSLIDCSKFLLSPLLVFYSQQSSRRELWFNSIYCVQRVNFNQVSLCWRYLPLNMSIPLTWVAFIIPRGKYKAGQWVRNAPCLITALAMHRGRHKQRQSKITDFRTSRTW